MRELVEGAIAAENIRVLGRALVNVPYVSPAPAGSGRDKLSALAGGS